MKLTPWINVGSEGTPYRSGDYQFELWVGDTVMHIYGSLRRGGNSIVTDDGRFIGLCYEDYWRGVLK